MLCSNRHLGFLPCGAWAPVKILMPLFSAACMTVRHLLHKLDSKLTVFGGFVTFRYISCTEVGISCKNHRTDTGRVSGPETWDGILSVTSRPLISFWSLLKCSLSTLTCLTQHTSHLSAFFSIAEMTLNLYLYEKANPRHSGLAYLIHTYIPQTYSSGRHKVSVQ